VSDARSVTGRSPLALRVAPLVEEREPASRGEHDVRETVAVHVPEEASPVHVVRLPARDEVLGGDQQSGLRGELPVPEGAAGDAGRRDEHDLAVVLPLVHLGDVEVERVVRDGVALREVPVVRPVLVRRMDPEFVPVHQDDLGPPVAVEVVERLLRDPALRAEIDDLEALRPGRGREETEQDRRQNPCRPGCRTRRRGSDP
jgi:hypothetical protein